MEKQEFKIKEVDVLKDLKGKVLNKIIYTDPVFAKVLLNFNEYNIIINNNNNVHEETFTDLEEELISYFTIDKVNNDNDSDIFNGEKQYTLDINEKITSIEVVNDLINIDDKYEVSYDSAIILITDKHQYTISRDWFFMETMEISVDKDIDDVLNKDTIIEQYKGDNNSINVSINRSINKIA